MTRLRNFFVSAVVGGLVVLLPLSVLVFFGYKAVAVLASVSDSAAASLGVESRWLQAVLALAALGAVVLVCFFVGLALRTRAGSALFGVVERGLDKIPMYDLLKRVASHSTGRGAGDFSPVLLELPGLGVSVPAFLIEPCGRDRAVVFVPLSPTPGVGHVLVADKARLRASKATLIPVMDGLMTWGLGLGGLYGDKEEGADGISRDGCS